MLWPRQICPFGLPDEEAETEYDVVLVSVGHVLRVASADITDAPFPAHLAGLLQRLGSLGRRGRGNPVSPTCRPGRSPKERKGGTQSRSGEIAA